jgi:excisionase family DNA binding protein
MVDRSSHNGATRDRSIPTEADMTSEYGLAPKWYTTAQVAEMLGFGLFKTKALIVSGELRSLKDGRYRRILPEWVDEYVHARVLESGR